MMRQISRTATLLLLVSAIAGCGMTNGELRLDDLAHKDGHKRDGVLPANATYVEKGQRHYRDGAFGLAEKHFRAAVEKEPADAEAWVGLAASYDQLRRFDHAERAYQSVIKLVGHTPTVLNNLGYHYYLRGNKRSAVQALERAHQADPDNQYIVNNLQTIRGTATGRTSSKG